MFRVTFLVKLGKYDTETFFSLLQNLKRFLSTEPLGHFLPKKSLAIRQKDEVKPQVEFLWQYEQRQLRTPRSSSSCTAIKPLEKVLMDCKNKN